MPETSLVKKHLWLAAKLAVGVSLAGAIWSLLSEETCADCGTAAQLLGDLPLGWLGAVFYAALFAAMLGKKRSAFHVLGIHAAASAHLVLLGLLLYHRIACAPCILTACGALLAAFLCVATEKIDLRRAFVIVPVAVLLTFVGYKAMRVSVIRSYKQAADQLLAALSRESRQVPPGKARMVVYVRPNCKYCAILKSELVPAFQKEFKGALIYEERPAPEDAAVPTIILLGAENKAFVGLPPEKDLRNALQNAQRPPSP